MTVTVHHGDSREVLKGIADCSIDSCVTDPPYALVSIVKRFGAANAAPARGGGFYARASAGFMGKQWDTGETAFDPAFWAEVMRVMKPGAHLIAFSGTRTYHRLAAAIEDAGFEIRDMIQWLYGSGFPKSHDVAKGIDKANGDERPVVGDSPFASRKPNGSAGVNSVGLTATPGSVVTSAASAASAAWEGWGTALKPACEPIVLARKPLIGTVAANVLAHGTGALNIDGCRIGTREDKGVRPITERRHDDVTFTLAPTPTDATKGRWPANVIHDGSEEVVEAFPETASGSLPAETIRGRTSDRVYGDRRGVTGSRDYEANSGFAARFFYSAKADAADRCGSKHPTVKPVDLMAYLCRLVTPPGGVVLDPFAGSGTTGMACLREGFDAVLIEREAEYVADINRRLAHVAGEDTPLFAPVNDPDLPANNDKTGDAA